MGGDVCLKARLEFVGPLTDGTGVQRRDFRGFAENFILSIFRRAKSQVLVEATLRHELIMAQFTLPFVSMNLNMTQEPPLGEEQRAALLAPQSGLITVALLYVELEVVLSGKAHPACGTLVWTLRRIAMDEHVLIQGLVREVLLPTVRALELPSAELGLLLQLQPLQGLFPLFVVALLAERPVRLKVKLVVVAS